MKNKKIKLTVLAVVLLLAVTAGVTLAWMSDKPQVLRNTINMGGVATEIEENGSGSVKKSRIQNTGELDCLIRARVTISPAEAKEAIELTGKGNGWDWSAWDIGDGYVYYTKAVPAQAGEASYTSYLFEGVALKEGVDWSSLGIDTFDITIYEESVQVKVHDGEKMISALDDSGNYDADLAAKVWKVYDTASVAVQTE